MPKVSVIIPTFNRAAMVCETIESVLAQTYKDFEIIVIDDGSTDNTREMLKQFGSKIKYIYQNNQGQAMAMNNGIKISEGEYFANIGDDDLWLPEFLEYQTAVLDKNPEFAFVCSGLYFIDGVGKIFKTSTEGSKRQKTFDDLVQDNFVFHLTALVRRKCFDD